MGIATMMIIDDSPADQFLAKIAIEEFDPRIEVLQAIDGQEALDLLSTLTSPPEVIFLDINMPRMNGHEFLARYSQWDTHASVLVMLTSSDQQNDIDRTMVHNCVKDYLLKPLDSAKLLKLAESLDG